MLLLKKILLSELQVKRGHFIKDSSYDLLWDFLYGEKIIPESLADEIMDYVEGSEEDMLLPKKLQSQLLRASGKVVYKESENSIYVTKKETEDGVFYSGFDFSQTVRGGLFFFGIIFTEQIKEKISYSPKKQINLNKSESIHLSQVSREYLGKGYGKVLYNAVLNTTDLVYSDSILYTGSFKMWTNYIRSKCKFFGISSGKGVILPIFDGEEITKASIKKIASAPWGFVGITKKVPVKLVELQNFLNGKQPDSILRIMSSTKKMSTAIKDIESSVSIEDLIGQGNYFVETKRRGLDTAYLELRDSTIFVKETGDSLEYFVM